MTHGYNVESSINYLSFESLLKYSIKWGKLMSFFEFGPRSNYMINYKTYKVYTIDDIRSPENFNKFLIGITYGIGTTYNVGKTKLGVFFNHQYDYSGLVKKQRSLELVNDILHVRNNSYLLGIVIGFISKKENTDSH